MIFLIAYASVAVVMIGVQCWKIDLNADDDFSAWMIIVVITAAIWPITLSYYGAKWLSSRPPACACGLRARKGGKFCARCGSKIGATNG